MYGKISGAGGPMQLNSLVRDMYSSREAKEKKTPPHRFRTGRSVIIRYCSIKTKEMYGLLIYIYTLHSPQINKIFRQYWHILLTDELPWGAFYLPFLIYR